MSASRALREFVGLQTRFSPVGGVIAAFVKSALNVVSMAATSAAIVGDHGEVARYGVVIRSQVQRHNRRYRSSTVMVFWCVTS